jgi:hypothetical protein
VPSKWAVVLCSSYIPAIAAVRRGRGPIRGVQKELDEAEGKVQILIMQRDGLLKAEPSLTDKTLKSPAWGSRFFGRSCPPQLTDSAYPFMH